MSYDAPSVPFRLQVAEASLERERAKLHEAAKEQVQGKAFQNLKRLAKKMFWQQAHSLDHQTSIAIKRRWCRPSVILRFFFLWRYFDKMIQMAILNLCCDSGCRKRAGCRTCIFSRGCRAVLTFTLAVVILKVRFVVAVLQNTGTTAAETAEGGVAVSGYQIASTASMEEHCRSSPGKQRSFDAPSVPFRLQVAEASLERGRAKLHEATKEQVQGKAFQNLKRLAKKMFWQQAHSLDHQTSIAIKRRWCRPSLLLRFFFLWRYFDKMIQMAIWQFGNFSSESPLWSRM